MTRYRVTDSRGVGYRDDWTGCDSRAADGDVIVPHPSCADRLERAGSIERLGRAMPSYEREEHGPLGPCGDCGKGIGHAPEPMLPGHPDGTPICGECRERRIADGTCAD